MSPKTVARALAAWARATRDESLPVDLLLVAVRAALAGVFFSYGAGKLFGWFHGPGLHATSQYFAATAHLRPGGLFAVVSGALEVGGALALMLGLASRLAGLALAAEMAVAVATVTGAHGFDPRGASPGYGYNVVLAALSLVVVVMGAGRLSVDGLVRARPTAPAQRSTSPSSTRSPRPSA